jgi:hypothetical protein
MSVRLVRRRADIPADIRFGSSRVDIAMSTARSAIHNTGHYHVRLRPVWLPLSCTGSRITVAVHSIPCRHS